MKWIFILLLLAGAGGYFFFQYSDQTKEIRLCFAIKDFYKANKRAPNSFGELSEKAQKWAAVSPDGKPYNLTCTHENPPNCAVVWDEKRATGSDGTATVSNHQRVCGPLNQNRWIDWF